MVYENIAAMMEAYAEQAVEAARKMNITLDYKEDSIERLEKILSQLHAARPVFLGKVARGEDDPAQKQIDSMSRIWGGYFGEVIRRCWGGEWTLETYPGTVAPMVTLEIDGSKIFPAMKVYRRLTNGAGDDVAKFYQMVREKLQKNRKLQ
jgi:hypothetical protein